MQPVFYNGFLAFLPWLAGFFLLGVGGSLFMSKETAKHRVIGVGLVAVSIVGMMASGANIFANTQVAQAEARFDEAQRVYGLDISAHDFYELRYPSDQPSEDFQAYGTATITTEREDGGLEQKRLTLVWQDGEFRLFQGEGAVTTLDELPRSNR